MLKKGFSTILVVVVVLVVGGGILVWQYWPESVVQEPTAEDQVGTDQPVVENGTNVETMNLEVYFVDKQMMLEGTSDYKDMVKPIIRTVPKTQAVAKAAIEELLKGLMNNEKAIYSDSIPTGTKMNSISINNGITYIDFSKELSSRVGGSATVSSIEWQIKKTLMQFSTVDSVVISIEGKTDLILQP